MRIKWGLRTGTHKWPKRVQESFPEKVAFGVVFGPSKRFCVCVYSVEAQVMKRAVKNQLQVEYKSYIYTGMMGGERLKGIWGTVKDFRHKRNMHAAL